MQTNKYQNGISNIKQQRAKGRIGWSILCRTLRLGMEAGEPSTQNPGESMFQDHTAQQPQAQTALLV